jgi:hypothetical protein
MSGNVRGVRKRGADLVHAQQVLSRNCVGRLTGSEGSNDRGDVDSCAAQARLPESDVGVHRDTWKDFHDDNSNTRSQLKVCRTTYGVFGRRAAGALSVRLTYSTPQPHYAVEASYGNTVV